jgi:hypothetical protein
MGRLGGRVSHWWQATVVEKPFGRASPVHKLWPIAKASDPAWLDGR